MFYRIWTNKGEAAEEHDGYGETIWLCDDCLSNSDLVNEDQDEVIDRVRYWSDEAIGVSCDGCGFET